jgi:serine protease Do
MRRWQAAFFGRWSQIVFWAGIALVVWFLLGTGAWGPRWWWPFKASRPAIVEAPPRHGPADGWTAVARAAMPAVVNISSARTMRGGERGPGPFLSDPFYRFFFGPEPPARRERSLGSGVIVTGDGYVLTNNHVVEGAEDIRVTFADRRELRARLVGGDPQTDLAVLKLPGSGFPVVPFGDSNKVEVAEVVLAIGNPFGLSQTVTMGIVSAVGRANVGIADYEDFIQTDAAINPGNSGGALVASRGELIGINTAIFSESGGYMGIGFAVPVNMARPVMDQLVTRGRVTRGWLGVAVQELTESLARGLGLPEVRGIIVADIMPSGPAERAGLRRGDVITAVDGKPVDDPGHFRNLIAQTTPGSTVRLSVLREGRPQTLEVAIAEAPERPVPAAAVPGPSRRESLGMSVGDLTPDLARALGPSAPGHGALVTGIVPGGIAEDSGLRAGDVILEVNGRPVRLARDFGRALEEARGKDVVVTVNRGGQTAYVVLDQDRA